MTANSAIVLGPKTIETTVKMISNVIDPDFRSTKRALWLVASWSRGPDQISNVSQPGYNSAVVARSGCFAAIVAGKV